MRLSDLELSESDLAKLQEDVAKGGAGFQVVADHRAAVLRPAVGRGSWWLIHRIVT